MKKESEMDSHEFTPGPWYIKPSEEIPSPYRGITSSTRITILDARDGRYKPRRVIAQAARGNGRGDADAAPIAAAPELYEELEKHRAPCMMMHPDCEGCEICDAGKVPKKARGDV